jgi:hypothetical protein
MRRLVLAALLAAAPFAPAAHADGVCVATGGNSACPSAVSRCSANQLIRVTVYGTGSGTASCGGASATCFSFRVSCTDDARATSSGTLTCAASSTAAVAVCAVVVESA